MRWIQIAILALGFIPYTLAAETTLYSCTVNGETTLQSMPGKECDSSKTYKYPSYEPAKSKNDRTPTTGLRPEEIRQLQALEQQLQQQSAERIAQQTTDPIAAADRQERCAAYRAQLTSALAFFGIYDIPQNKQSELNPHILTYATIVRSDRSGSAVKSFNRGDRRNNRFDRRLNRPDDGRRNDRTFIDYGSADNEFAFDANQMKALVTQAQSQIKNYCYDN